MNSSDLLTLNSNYRKMRELNQYKFISHIVELTLDSIPSQNDSTWSKKVGLIMNVIKTKIVLETGQLQ